MCEITLPQYSHLCDFLPPSWVLDGTGFLGGGVASILTGLLGGGAASIFSDGADSHESATGFASLDRGVGSISTAPYPGTSTENPSSSSYVLNSNKD